jgi:putative Holliday junction resolvase
MFSKKFFCFLLFIILKNLFSFFFRLRILRHHRINNFPSPLSTYLRQNVQKDLTYLSKQIQEWQICSVIFGLPIHMSGDMSGLALQVVGFSKKLEPIIYPIPIYFYDERWTTQAVERQMIAADLSRKRRAQIVDKLAACYLLQGILDAL